MPSQIRSVNRCLVTIPSAISVVRACSSASAELRLTHYCVGDRAERVAFPHGTTPPLVLLQVMGGLAQSLHGLRECTDFDQALCTRDTFQVSCDALHVHLVALSGTQDLSCCFLHAVHALCVCRSPARPATQSWVFCRHLVSTQVLSPRVRARQSRLGCTSNSLPPNIHEPF